MFSGFDVSFFKWHDCLCEPAFFIMCVVINTLRQPDQAYLNAVREDS